MSYIQLIKALENHDHYNIPKNDGCICFYCKDYIPIVYTERRVTGGRNKGHDKLFHDRSNRVDVVNGTNMVLSYHVICWRAIIYESSE